MKRFAAHGPMIEDAEQGGYVRYEDNYRLLIDRAAFEGRMVQAEQEVERLREVIARFRERTFELINDNRNAEDLVKELDAAIDAAREGDDAKEN